MDEFKRKISGQAETPQGSNEKTIWDFLTGKGLNAYAVAGIMGNLYAESGLMPNNLQNTNNNSWEKRTQNIQQRWIMAAMAIL